MADALRRAPGIAGRLPTGGVDLSSGPALRAACRTADHDTVVVYVVGGRRGLWALLLRTPTARAGRDGRLFARIARSLAPSAPVGGPYELPDRPAHRHILTNS